MKKKQWYWHRTVYIYIIAVSVLIVTLIYCFSMIRDINQRMNESATSNLLNTTKVIKETVEKNINKDFEALYIIGEVYKNGFETNSGQLQIICDSMGFERVAVADEEGNGVDSLSNPFSAADMPWHGEWSQGMTGYSDAYFGNSGRLQTTLWVPVYRGEELIGTVFGDVILTKYYSASVFTFYEGAGRTYLIDGTDGDWILRSLGTDGASRRHADLFSLLANSGNKEDDVERFKHAISDRKTGTAAFNFNGEQSYVCFIPLTSSDDWYVTTVIPRDVLLKESTQVQQIIRMILIVFCVTWIVLSGTFAVWQIRKTKEHEAHYREALFANVSSNIDSAFLIYDKNNKKTAFVSQNTSRLLGLEREWLQKAAEHLFDWCNITAGDVQRTAFLDGTLNAPAVREVCVENELGEKSRYIRLELIPADLDQEIAVLTDITKDRVIQASLVDAMRRAEAASNAKNNFLSAMSHDIRTPMNGIVGMTAIAAAHIDDRNRVQDCLKKITEASAHLLSLINEVLDMSQIESGKVELSEEAFNLAELLQEVLNMNYPGIRQKDQKIKVHIHSLEHERVVGDSVRLQRIVGNLISNAIKYTPDEGTITIKLREKQAVIKGYGCYELTVQDNGIGMSEEFLKRIFQPFEREEDVRTSRIQGTGLGMAIVKNMVSLMMGNIQVESEKNKGSTFRVTVNLRLDSEEGEKYTELEKLPVLVVDDDEVTCETVSGMLCDIGMLGEWADSGELALTKVAERHSRKEDYMAVILDWKMPGMDGVEIARRIRSEIDENVPIIILTAYDWSEIEAEAREAGVDAFMTKPIYRTKLQEKLQEVAGGRKEMPLNQKKKMRSMIPEGRRILLVEDNELNREIAVELLNMMGIKVVCTINGIEAVDQFRSSVPGTYDLILMDIQMPVMNGYEATKCIRNLDRADSRSIPIIAMTADAFMKDVQAVHEAGMNEHIAKPISVERLAQVLNHFLSASRGEMDQEGEEQDEAMD